MQVRLEDLLPIVRVELLEACVDELIERSVDVRPG
jgi:hypothetical protein